jgi:hypothetical protein
VINDTELRLPFWREQAPGFLEHAFRAQRRRAGDDQSKPGGRLKDSAKLFEIIALSRASRSDSEAGWERVRTLASLRSQR